MIEPGVPQLAVIVGRRRGIFAVEHRIERKLQGNGNHALVAGIQAHSSRESPAGALATHHDTRLVDAKLVGMRIHPLQRSIAVGQRRRIAGLPREPVVGIHHYRPEALREHRRARHTKHIQTSVHISPAVYPKYPGHGARCFLGLQDHHLHFPPRRLYAYDVG